MQCMQSVSILTQELLKVEVKKKVNNLYIILLSRKAERTEKASLSGSKISPGQN